MAAGSRHPHPGADRAGGIDHVVETAGDSGVDTSLPAKVLEIFQRGIADGRSEDGATSLVEILKKASA
jgi:hypothetical protein